jgi:putative transposase
LRSGQVQKAAYGHLRNHLNLKSQMSGNVARRVSGAYKTFQSQIDKEESDWQLIDFSPTPATFSFERDFTFSKGTLSITTLSGRKKDIPDKNVVDASTFMGVDVGINCLAVASTMDKKCKFFAGGEIKNHRNTRSKERR